MIKISERKGKDVTQNKSKVLREMHDILEKSRAHLT